MPSRRQHQKTTVAEAPVGGPPTWLLSGMGIGALAAVMLAIVASSWPSDLPLDEDCGCEASAGDNGPQAFGTEGSVLTRLGLSRVLVLRLKRKPARAAKLAVDAEQLGVPLDMHDATDGLWNESFRSQVLPLHSPKGTCADLAGAIFNTHERAWTLAAEEPRPTLLLEDDVRLPVDFVEYFSRRMQVMPQDFHVALAGSSVTPGATPISEFISRPDIQDPNGQAFLGLWGYVVSPAGARLLLQLAEQVRTGRRRFFQPVDLFIAHRLRHINTYAMEPPAQLIDEFQQMKDIPILSTMRQVGVVFLTAERSTNQPNEDEETAEIHKLSDKVVRLGEQGDYLKSWKAARKAIRIMRHYSCWHSAQLLQNAGVSLLRLLGNGRNQHGPAGFANVNETLLTCLEALASSVRYTSGTWMERKKLADFPEWVNAALAQMRRNGQKLAAPPLGWGSRQPLPRGGWLLASVPPEIVELTPLKTGAHGLDLSTVGRFGD
mmetsp:Transcript_19456/g.61092  ORF Transcript_19456/g.61092 Transcript_19456/m.61092 type:complete len:490 (+) Transcript_19456:61-1530(+)